MVLIGLILILAIPLTIFAINENNELKRQQESQRIELAFSRILAEKMTNRMSISKMEKHRKQLLSSKFLNGITDEIFSKLTPESETNE